jgi:tripartite-type tricarboxylate transporter receptor subunit TctC
VPFAAGGPTDKVARDLAEAAQAAEQPDRRHRERGRCRRHAGRGQGGQGRPGRLHLLLHHIGMATSPALYRNLPYKTLDDFEYLGMVNDVPMTLIGRPRCRPATTPN